ncbi:acyltransferase [Nakamurella silvestris]|nr:acyltransferase [Nakamurella silvestris]
MEKAAVVVRAAPSTGFRADIQGMRALAVGLVVAAHAGVSSLAGGFTGVDIFFVLSGYLITGLLLADAARGRIDYARFYTRRALRIVPAATLVILTTGIASLYLLSRPQAVKVLTDGIWTSLFGANITFSRDGTDYFADDAVSPLRHFWSLSVEEQFYLVWPALLGLVLLLSWGLARRGRPAAFTDTVGPDAQALPAPEPAIPAASTPELSTPAPNPALSNPTERQVPRVRIAVVLAVLGAVSLWISVSRTASDPTGAYFSTFARAWELIAGALAATCLPWLRRLNDPVRTALTWIGVAGIVLAAVTFDEQTPFPGSAALLPVLSTCALLVGGLGAPRWGANRLLSVRPLRFVGDISYSLYLWHWPLLVLGAAWVGEPLNGRQSLKLVVAAVVLSTVSYYLVENPARHSRRIWRGRPLRALVIWPLAVSAVVALSLVGSSLTPPPPPPGLAIAADEAAGVSEVEEAVLSARANAQIPRNLDPAVDRIAADRVALGNCSAYERTTSDICQFGDPAGSQTVVMFGNSHATHWVPALTSVATDANWQFFPLVKEGCDYAGFYGSDTDCQQWYQWVRAQLAEMKPDVIVINAYTHGKSWRAGMLMVINDFGPLTGRIVMLTDPPGVKGNPADCLHWRRSTLGSCSSPEVEAKIADEVLEAEIAASTGIELVNVRSWFCWDGTCPQVIGNRVVYADGGHLTATYSRHLAGVLGPALALH